MKKSICLLLICFVAFSLSALSVTGHLGYASGIGVSETLGTFELGADLESSFPCYAIYSGNNTGAKQFFGINLLAYKSVTKHLYAGLETMFSLEPMLLKYNLNIRPSVKGSLDINNRTSVFVTAGIPLLNTTYIKGFKKPLLSWFDFSTVSVLLECFKCGISVEL